MNKKTVAVLFGGCSPEYEVSLHSAYSIINAINRENYEIVLLGITQQGEWYVYTGAVDNIPCDKWQEETGRLKRAVISPSRGRGLLVFDGDRVSTVAIDVVFPVLHGRFGEDGTVQGLCELSGIPCVGSGSASSALCMDKDRAHKLVSFAGIPVPGSVCFTHMPADEELAAAVRDFSYPLFVKPVRTGSSFGITMIKSYEELSDALAFAFTFDDAILIEEGVDGFEAGCAVIGNDELVVGRVDEIELSKGFFDYEEKYTLKTAKIHMPARIGADTEGCLQETAKAVYRILGCRGYCRIDLFLTKYGEIIFNEANTIPGFTAHSRFPSMMKGAGIDYPELVERLIGLALESK